MLVTQHQSPAEEGMREREAQLGGAWVMGTKSVPLVTSDDDKEVGS